MGDFEGWFAPDIDAFDRRVSREFAYIFVLVSLGLLGWPSAPLKGWIAGARCEQWCATNSFPDAVSAAKWFVNDKKNEAKGGHEEGRARPEYSQVLQDLPSAQHLLASSRKSPLNGRKINQVFVGNLEDLGGAGITEKIIGINLRCFWTMAFEFPLGWL